MLIIILFAAEKNIIFKFDIHGRIQKKLGCKTGNGDGQPTIFRFSLESGRDGLITFFAQIPRRRRVSELLRKKKVLLTFSKISSPRYRSFNRKKKRYLERLRCELFFSKIFVFE